MVFMCSNYAEWDEYYRKYHLEELGWELGKPRPILVEFLEKGFRGVQNLKRLLAIVVLWKPVRSSGFSSTKR
jgi:hypothetical protein